MDQDFVSEVLKVTVLLRDASDESLSTGLEECCKNVELIDALTFASVKLFEQMSVNKLHFLVSEVSQDDLFDVVGAAVIHLVTVDYVVIHFTLFWIQIVHSLAFFSAPSVLFHISEEIGPLLIYIKEEIFDGSHFCRKFFIKSLLLIK